MAPSFYSRAPPVPKILQKRRTSLGQRYVYLIDPLALTAILLFFFGGGDGLSVYAVVIFRTLRLFHDTYRVGFTCLPRHLKALGVKYGVIK